MAHRHHGQALVEMALTLTIILMVVLGGIAAVQIIGVHYSVAQAVRASAHQAALRGSTGGLAYDQYYPLSSAPGPVAEAARLALSGSVFADPEYAQIRASCATRPCRRYERIRVEIRYESEPWAPLPGLLDRISAQRSVVRSAEQDSQDG